MPHLIHRSPYSGIRSEDSCVNSRLSAFDLLTATSSANELPTALPDAVLRFQVSRRAKGVRAKDQGSKNAENNTALSKWHGLGVAGDVRVSSEKGDVTAVASESFSSC